jgi:hypothetical protein
LFKPKYQVPGSFFFKPWIADATVDLLWQQIWPSPDVVLGGGAGDQEHIIHVTQEAVGNNGVGHTV